MGLDFTGIGSVADFAKTVVDKIFPPKASPEDKLAARLSVQQLLKDRDLALLDTQKSIIVAELQQGDKFTKRARPSVVYVGLGAFLLTSVIIPIAGWIAKLSGFADELPTITLPTEFWYAWTSVTGIWAIGRTAEKRGISNKLVELITGK